jgi:hypothetical protein
MIVVITLIYLRRLFMKRILTAMLALTFLFVAVNVYACGEKNGSAKAEASKANAEMTSAADGACHSETEAAKASVVAPEPDANTSVSSTEQDAKVVTADSKEATVMSADVKSANCPWFPGCCDGKGAKASNANQKVEAKENKVEAASPVLIMSAPVETKSSQE